MGFRLSYAISTQATNFQAVSYNVNLADRLARLVALGYDGVELHVRDPYAEDVPALKATLDASGLVVSAIGTGQAYGEDGLSFTDERATVRRRAMRRCLAFIDLAAMLAPNQALVIIGLMRGRATPKVGAGQAHAWLAAALRDLADYAGTQAVRLCIEPINRYETNLLTTVADTLDLLDRLDAPNVGLLFDLFHANIEEASIERSMALAAPRLYHVHVADSNRWYPGAGHLDFPRLLHCLTLQDYQGWLSAEVLPRPDVETAVTQTMTTLKPLIHLV